MFFDCLPAGGFELFTHRLFKSFTNQTSFVFQLNRKSFGFSSVSEAFHRSATAQVIRVTDVPGGPLFTLVLFSLVDCCHRLIPFLLSFPVLFPEFNRRRPKPES